MFWQASSLHIESRKVDLDLPYFFYCFEAQYTESTHDLKVDVDDSMMFLKSVTLKYLWYATEEQTNF